jgi:hypothetical protein
MRYQTVFRRVVVLCGMGCTVFTLRGMFSIYGGAALRGSIGYPTNVEDRFAFDALGYLFAELLPVTVVLRLTRQKRRQEHFGGGRQVASRWTRAAAPTAADASDVRDGVRTDNRNDDDYPAAIAPAWAREPPPRASATAPLLRSQDDE